MLVHISVYTMYTVCNRRYTGRYVEGVYTEFYTCGRIPYMSVHISVYIMYTVYNRRYVEGVYTEFYSCGRVPSSSGYMSVYRGKSRGILNVVWKESVLISYIL